MGLILAGAITGSLAIGPMESPADASTGSTLTTVAALAALVGGIVLYNNYEHRRETATTIVGYTRNGGTVYGDGRIVLPNGQAIYPNQSGYYPWGQPAYYRSNASGYEVNPTAYRTNNDERYRGYSDYQRPLVNQYRFQPPYGRYARGRGPSDRGRAFGHDRGWAQDQGLGHGRGHDHGDGH